MTKSAVMPHWPRGSPSAFVLQAATFQLPSGTASSQPHSDLATHSTKNRPSASAHELDPSIRAAAVTIENPVMPCANFEKAMTSLQKDARKSDFLSLDQASQVDQIRWCVTARAQRPRR